MFWTEKRQKDHLISNCQAATLGATAKPTGAWALLGFSCRAGLLQINPAGLLIVHLQTLGHFADIRRSALRTLLDGFEQ